MSNDDAEMAIAALERHWDVDGVLYRLRDGKFDEKACVSFLGDLKQVDLPADRPVERRLVSLLWYLQPFLGWQVDRIGEAHGDVVAYERFRDAVHAELERILGIP
jgi:hypothetical protein